VVFDVKKDVKSRVESEGLRASRLDTETSLAPMSSLGVVPDGVVGPEADPLGDGPVLLLCASKLLLGAERLLGRHRDCLTILLQVFYLLAQTVFLRTNNPHL